MDIKDALPKGIKIAVLAGGESAEREVSIQSGTSIFNALKIFGCSVEFIQLEHDKVDIQLLKNFDVVFIAMHGAFGEDGQLQKILQDNDIVFTGSDEKSCFAAFDKKLTKQAFEARDVNTPEWLTLCSPDDISAVKEKFKFPVVVKPVTGGSSQGVHIVKCEENLSEAISDAFKYSGEVMIEYFVKGRELTVGILDGETLPVIELRTKREFYDYEAKYIDDDTEYLCPANLESGVLEKINKEAIKAFDAVGARDFSRVDIMIDESNHPYVLEVNIIPGFTSHSLLPKAAGVYGLDFPQLCEKIISLALEHK